VATRYPLALAAGSPDVIRTLNLKNSLSMRLRPFAAGPAIPPLLVLGYAAALAVVITIAFLSKFAIESQANSARWVSHTLAVKTRLASLLSSIKDAESSQRGYLLTGRPEYLEPFESAIKTVPAELKALAELIADNAAQISRLAELDAVVREKLAELRETIEQRRAGNANAALSAVLSGRGKNAMDRIRMHVQALDDEESKQLAARSSEWEDRVARSTAIMVGGAGLLFLLIVSAAYGTLRELIARERQTWVRNGQVDVAQAALVGEQSVATLAQRVLDQCVRYTGAAVGAFYVVHEDGSVRRAAGHALPAAAEGELLARGEGLTGQALNSSEIVQLDRLPPSYLQVGSTLGVTAPVDVLIVPAYADGAVYALMELAFLRRAEPRIKELMEQVADPIAVAVRTALLRARLADLLRRTQRQSEELQAQQEELEASNEELGEQSRALQESQARLETQQAELEQINERLHEQAALLERQKDELMDAQDTMRAKNDELERANRHKSEFLANMSHELRTPLNSSLILAKLLADNRGGNLTEEQVRFAQSIYSAGNDLLNLINDILDLSKVEAGKLEVRSEPIALERLVEGLVQTFRPIAGQKGIKFAASIAENAPERVETDPQRLEQILKNLLSNAFKFTERGEVALTVSRTDDARLAFAVRDTGLGIARDQHGLVFQAFKQIDSGANRRYGGTGLGLSISRDLARLLGGDIELASTPGQGSIFTLILPQRYVRPEAPSTARQMSAGTDSKPKPAQEAASGPVLSDGVRRLLIVEDDAPFVDALTALGREQGYECLVATRADEAVRLAALHAPSAILLDIRLPDHSGLSVLDRLKRNPTTRHIPVHIISALDYSQTALEMGAVGYALKPVAREDVVSALRKLSSAAEERSRRVLVVEDDDVQRESICRLLTGDGVETIAVATAAEGLVRLRESSFHCMVLDLNLPDTTGYDMLEAMAADERYSFPPVIVYTAGSINSADEDRLRRYSRSIIIKGARSPERLLDEVMLFLHQVEAKLPADRRKMLQEARDREALFEGRVILLVEDDVRNIFALTSMLEPRGAKLVIARNGREALERLAQSASVDLVLMDIMMPEMDGLEAIRRIRARGDLDKLPIIALTAKAMRDDQEKCLAAGANDYVAKPIDVDKLLSLIRVWMPR
jgi:CheY-like chemotaxis protein/CHASE3 domain sensor protein/nitrogen-specific signal transduction histidine kinase